MLPTRYFQTTEIYCVVVLGAESPKSDCWQGHVPRETGRRGSLPLWLLAFPSIPRHSLACGRIATVTASVTCHTAVFSCRSYGFPGGSEGKESTCSARDLGSVPGLGRYPGEGNGYSPQYSYLGNSRDRGAWQATVQGIAKSQT